MPRAPVGRIEDTEGWPGEAVARDLVEESSATCSLAAD